MQIFSLLVFFSTSLLAATFTHPEKGFSLDYDATQWEVVAQPTQEKVQGDAVDKEMAGKTLLTLQRKTADDKYRARFSVVLDAVDHAKKNEKEAPLTRYRHYASEFLKSQRFTVEENKELLHTGLKETTANIKAYQRDFGLTFHQVIALKGQEAFLLTGAARTKQYDLYAPEIDKMIQSFKF